MQRARVRLVEVSEPDLGPGVSLGYRIGQVCIRSKGLVWVVLGQVLDYARKSFFFDGRQEDNSLISFLWV